MNSIWIKISDADINLKDYYYTIVSPVYLKFGNDILEMVYYHESNFVNVNLINDTVINGLEYPGLKIILLNNDLIKLSITNADFLYHRIELTSGIFDSNHFENLVIGNWKDNNNQFYVFKNENHELVPEHLLIKHKGQEVMEGGWSISKIDSVLILKIRIYDVFQDQSEIIENYDDFQDQSVIIENYSENEFNGYFYSPHAEKFNIKFIRTNK